MTLPFVKAVPYRLAADAPKKSTAATTLDQGRSGPLGNVKAKRCPLQTNGAKSGGLCAVVNLRQSLIPDTKKRRCSLRTNKEHRAFQTLPDKDLTVLIEASEISVFQISTRLISPSRKPLYPCASWRTIEKPERE